VKILIISQYFWPENFRINDLATDLVIRGHEITVLTGWPNYPEGKVFEDFKKHPEKYSSLNGAKIIRVPLIPRGEGGMRLILNYLSFVFSASGIGSLKLTGKKFDVIFVYEPSPITVGIPAIIIKTLKKAPIAFWVLDLWPETLSAIGVIKSKPLLSAVGQLVRFIYKKCDLILAQSNSFIDNIRVYCPDFHKIKYFPSWSEELAGQELTVIAPEIEKKIGGFTILFAGNIGDAQSFPTIVDAAELLHGKIDVRWIIVGDGRKANWVKEQIEARNLQNTIIMTGRYPLDRMSSFFAHADALLVTLKANEVFSMTIPAKIQTYLSSGLPIIAALNGEGANVVIKACAGYTSKAEDAEALAEAVKKMANLSANERAAMGLAGRSYYAAHFEKKLLIDQLEGYLGDLQLSQSAVNKNA
jgi:colanic acid biosynthesis glycosyl transferase WcaI